MRMGKRTDRWRWPKRLYIPPDEWGLAGDVYAMDECELCRTVSHFHLLGGRWRRVSKRHATPIYLVTVLDEYTAIYKRESELYLVRWDSPGWYRWEPYGKT
jgi:hypothetical protein